MHATRFVKIGACKEVRSTVLKLKTQRHEKCQNVFESYGNPSGRWRLVCNTVNIFCEGARLCATGRTVSRIDWMFQCGWSTVYEWTRTACFWETRRVYSVLNYAHTKPLINHEKRKITSRIDGLYLGCRRSFCRQTQCSSGNRRVRTEQWKSIILYQGRNLLK